MPASPSIHLSDAKLSWARIFTNHPAIVMAKWFLQGLGFKSDSSLTFCELLFRSICYQFFLFETLTAVLYTCHWEVKWQKDFPRLSLSAKLDEFCFNSFFAMVSMIETRAYNSLDINTLLKFAKQNNFKCLKRTWSETLLNCIITRI